MKESADISALTTRLNTIKGVGPKLTELFEKKGLSYFEDVLYFLPREYQDRTVLTPMSELQVGEHATIEGEIQSARSIPMRGRQGRFEAVIADDHGRVRLSWFHAFPSLKNDFEPGTRMRVFGQVQVYAGIFQITHPEYEIVGDEEAAAFRGKVIPIYSETEGLSQKAIRKVVDEVLARTGRVLVDGLSEEQRRRMRMMTLSESLQALHRPRTFPDDATIQHARRRLVFEEFFIMQLGLVMKKRQLRSGKAPVIKDTSLGLFLQQLPFELTDDQKKTIGEISRDLSSGLPMVRLVQGDVGAGKTVVALAAAFQMARAGFQTALMAPTEILAQQHWKTAQRFLKDLLPSELLVSQNSSQKDILERIRSGTSSLIIGTHALFQRGIQFKSLGLVIVDEQHRFGVEQRGELLKKGMSPHLLMMTATPIPRTLALTQYGDLDLSLIRQKPAGRLPVKTKVLFERHRARVYEKMRELVKSGQQTYVIYPLVEASEKLDLRSATEMYEKLRAEFPDARLGLLHGRLKSEEKDLILQQFQKGEIDILVSTTVVEVGIDVPNATMMVIEHPERLGLAQLHQLRGRVGRGKLESFCILMSTTRITDRLQVMEQTEDGFLVAEADLKIRGPGEFLGTRQSGLMGFRVADLILDSEILEHAKTEAERVLSLDPTLDLPEHETLRYLVETHWKKKLDHIQS